MKACSSLWARFVQPCNSALLTARIWEVGAPHETWTISADPDLSGCREGIPHSWAPFQATLFLNEYLPHYFTLETITSFRILRLKAQCILLTTQKHDVPPKAFNPVPPTEIPLSAAWPCWLAYATEQTLSLIPSGLCKINIHHRHSTWSIFVSGAGSYIEICGCKQQVGVTEPAFQETPKLSQMDAKKQLLRTVMQRSFIDFIGFIFRCNDHQFPSWCTLPNTKCSQSCAKAQEMVTTAEHIKWNLSLVHTNNFTCKLTDSFQLFPL